MGFFLSLFDDGFDEVLIHCSRTPMADTVGQVQRSSHLMQWTVLPWPPGGET